MTTNENAKPKHLLTNDDLTAHAGATTEDLIHGHRMGNGLRVHAIYILIVYVAALLLIVGGIAIASR